MQNSKRKAFKHLSATVCLIILFLITTVWNVNAATDKTYISDLRVISGADSRTQLEGDGYSVLFQGMNLSSEGSSTVTLGYKKGGTAITGLVVCSQYVGSLKYNGCSFLPVSGTNLNEGTNGSPLYLYYTKDAAAGAGITHLDTVSGFTDRDEVISLKNDGSDPVLMNDGTLANLDKGIDNSELYLLTYRSGNIKRYIADACIVKGTAKAEAVNSAASKGCTFYLDYDMSGEGEVSYIAYRRTADKNEAITKISINGSDLSFEKDQSSGTHLIDISNYKLFDQNFELGNWAGVYISYDKSVSKTSAEFKKLSKSTEGCSCVQAGDAGIYAIYEGSADGIAEQPQVVSETEPDESSNDEIATDEFYNIDKSDDSEIKETENSDDGGETTASIIGGGSTTVLTCLLLIIIAVAAYFLILKKKKGKNGEEQNSEKQSDEKRNNGE